MRLPRTAQALDATPRRRGKRGLDGAHEKGVADADAVQGLAKDAGLQTRDIDRDIRKLGHGYSPASAG